MFAKNKTRLPWPAIVFLVAIHILVLCAGFFAPYDFSEQNRSLALAPPARLHFVDSENQFHWRPFVYHWVPRAGRYGEYDEDRSRMFPVRFLVQGDEGRLLGFVSTRIHLFGVDSPAKLFLFGTDEYGRDQFSRFVYGGQISLFAGILAATLALGLGVALGTWAGFAGRWADAGIMRVAELFLSLPWLYLLFAVRAFLPLKTSSAQAFLIVIALIGFIGWAGPARMIRGIVLSAKERHFVHAARAFGASNAYLLRRHIVPQTYGVVLTQASLLVPQFLLAEVTLSFLGLGVGEPVPSWGAMLGSMQHYHVLITHWWIFVPGLILIPLFLCYHSLASALEARLKIISL
jgi:peptide/nickel transport system permease protein